ncbi:hypothetical protein SNK05_013154 [Fusarium graminearum]
MSLKGKVVLVTGSTKGIGKAVIERVAADGASVVINYSSDGAPADEMVNKIGSDRALAIKADVSSIPDIEKLIQATVDKFGKIDCVMANAACAPMNDLESTTEEAFDKSFMLNVKGPYFLVQKAVPHMPRDGRVILVSTGILHNSNVVPRYLLYAASKGPIEQMTRVMAKELGAKHGITVNCIAPGPTATEMFFQGKSQEMIDTIAGPNYLTRIPSLAEPTLSRELPKGSEHRPETNTPLLKLPLDIMIQVWKNCHSHIDVKNLYSTCRTLYDMFKALGNIKRTKEMMWRCI